MTDKGLKESTNGNAKGYFLPAPLVNRLIFACISSIIVIGGYMILWAMNDAQWKAEQQTQIKGVVKDVAAMKRDGILPRADERIEALRRDLNYLDDKIKQHEQDHDDRK